MSVDDYVQTPPPEGVRVLRFGEPGMPRSLKEVPPGPVSATLRRLRIAAGFEFTGDLSRAAGFPSSAIDTYERKYELPINHPRVGTLVSTLAARLGRTDDDVRAELLAGGYWAVFTRVQAEKLIRDRSQQSPPPRRSTKEPTAEERKQYQVDRRDWQRALLARWGYPRFPPLDVLPPDPAPASGIGPTGRKYTMTESAVHARRRGELVRQLEAREARGETPPGGAPAPVVAVARGVGVAPLSQSPEAVRQRAQRVAASARSPIPAAAPAPRRLPAEQASAIRKLVTTFNVQRMQGEPIVYYPAEELGPILADYLTLKGLPSELLVGADFNKVFG